jgi:hypothetical protein
VSARIMRYRFPLSHANPNLPFTLYIYYSVPTFDYGSLGGCFVTFVSCTFYISYHRASEFLSCYGLTHTVRIFFFVGSNMWTATNRRKAPGQYLRSTVAFPICMRVAQIIKKSFFYSLQLWFILPYQATPVHAMHDRAQLIALDV